jgi:hypothetical protein
MGFFRFCSVPLLYHFWFVPHSAPCGIDVLHSRVDESAEKAPFISKSINPIWQIPFSHVFCPEPTLDCPRTSEGCFEIPGRRHMVVRRLVIVDCLFESRPPLEIYFLYESRRHRFDPTQRPSKTPSVATTALSRRLDGCLV